ncbi:hypothetical protein TNCV_2024951 [Trichonephila clavipes]|nr:hypothetical protein TNCV_2024951 [Trichonephila clavipes]
MEMMGKHNVGSRQSIRTWQNCYWRREMVFLYDPQFKRASETWKSPRSPRKQKFLQDHYKEKFMQEMFFDSHGGCGSRVVWVSDRGLPCHEFEPSTTKDPPCRVAKHVKSVES